MFYFCDSSDALNRDAVNKIIIIGKHIGVFFSNNAPSVKNLKNSLFYRKLLLSEISLESETIRICHHNYY